VRAPAPAPADRVAFRTPTVVIVYANDAGYASGMAETITSRHFRAHLSEVIDRARAGDSTVVTRNGRPVGAFVPMEVLEQARLREEEELRRIIEERRDSSTVSLAEVMAETLERDE